MVMGFTAKVEEILPHAQGGILRIQYNMILSPDEIPNLGVWSCIKYRDADNTISQARGKGGRPTYNSSRRHPVQQLASRGPNQGKHQN